MKHSRFEWESDRASLRFTLANEALPFWQGGILPSFVLLREGRKHYADSTVAERKAIGEADWQLTFAIETLGRGSLRLTLQDGVLMLRDLQVEWNEDTAIIAMHFGTKRLTDAQAAIAAVDAEEHPFWPNWRAHEICVPCASGAPSQSFFRCWDLGDAVLPLGSFGASMGTPYAAAFPRPLYAAAMGEKSGWLAFGPGEIPDAALTLRIKASAAYVEYLYREDLWGAVHPRTRFWAEPLRLAIGANAYEAYDALFQSMNVAPVERAQHLRSIFCTWGQFMKGKFDIRAAIDNAAARMPSDILLIDEAWESSTGSGRARLSLFPNFMQDLEYAKNQGMRIGLWQSLGWVHDPQEAGLNESDLLCGRDGKPRKTGWLQNPYMPTESLHYCLDPSSARARAYIQARAERVIREYGAELVKLDFGYALPSPDIAAPRDPAMRGERLCQTLLQLVRDAAKAVNPNTTLMYYGISPLMFDLFDFISIDDMGDCGDSPSYERAGHSQRCFWTTLAARQGMPVNTSSGYFWSAMDDILLDTTVTGINGTVLPETDATGQTITSAIECRWRAVSQWKRTQTTIWQPLFLDNDFGGSGSEPLLRSWARLETHNGQSGISAAALRSENAERSFVELPNVTFSGKWALVSLDDQDIAHCMRLAVIPFSAGYMKIDGVFARVEIVAHPRGTSEAVHADAEKWAVTITEADALVGYVLHRA